MTSPWIDFVFSAVITVKNATCMQDAQAEIKRLLLGLSIDARVGFVQTVGAGPNPWRVVAIDWTCCLTEKLAKNMVSDVSALPGTQYVDVCEKSMYLAAKANGMHHVQYAALVSEAASIAKFKKTEQDDREIDQHRYVNFGG